LQTTPTIVLIVSVIDFGAAASGSARKTIQERLNSTHHQGLRIALGDFRSTRIENLMGEAGSSTLDHQRLLITAKIAIIQSMTINEYPIKRKLEYPTTYDQYGKRIKITKPFHIRAIHATLNIDYQRIRLSLRMDAETDTPRHRDVVM
jgi:hypothetical protein